MGPLEKLCGRWGIFKPHDFFYASAEILLRVLGVHDFFFFQEDFPMYEYLFFVPFPYPMNVKIQNKTEMSP